MTAFEPYLRTIRRPLSQADLEVVKKGMAIPDRLEDAVPVVRRADGSKIVLSGLFGLLKVGAGRRWESKPASDAWFAPRLHWALRLTRREAADPGIWEWLAYRLSRTYVEWRWRGNDESVADSRYRGGINKQAFARLWWGAELFRNGDDYRAVERFFANQDFPNSYVHREFSRNRPLALAVVDELHERFEGEPTSQAINDVARNVNLWVAPLSLEHATGHWRPDQDRYEDWVGAQVPVEVPHPGLPEGPPDGRVPADVAAAARRLAAEVCDAAGL